MGSVQHWLQPAAQHVAVSGEAVKDDSAGLRLSVEPER